VIEGHVEHDAAGYLLTDANMQTSIPGLFAAGDVRVQLTRQVTTAVGDATTAAIAVEKLLAARKNGERAPAPMPMLPAWAVAAVAAVRIKSMRVSRLRSMATPSFRSAGV